MDLIRNILAPRTESDAHSTGMTSATDSWSNSIDNSLPDNADCVRHGMPNRLASSWEKTAECSHPVVGERNERILIHG